MRPVRWFLPLLRTEILFCDVMSCWQCRIQVKHLGLSCVCRDTLACHTAAADLMQVLVWDQILTVTGEILSRGFSVPAIEGVRFGRSWLWYVLRSCLKKTPHDCDCTSRLFWNDDEAGDVTFRGWLFFFPPLMNSDSSATQSLSPRCSLGSREVTTHSSHLYIN